MLYLEDEKPVILVVSESNLYLSKLVTDFLESNSLDVETLNLDQNFFLKYEELSKQKKRVYKVIFLYGFYSVSVEVYKRVFDFFDLLNKNQAENIPIILLSRISSSLEILDNFIPEYEVYLTSQNAFLSDFLSNFTDSMVFLSQDLLVGDGRLDYPLLLLFSAIKQNYLFDLQSNFYFQDEDSFFELVKESLIKPHKRTKFVVRGSAIYSKKLLEEIAYLYEQYFQKKPTLIKLFSDEKKRNFLQEFALVNNSKGEIKNLLDQIIRKIPDLDEKISLIAPSELELKKALEASRFQKAKQPKKLTTKRSEDVETNNLLDLITKAQKEPPSRPETENLGSEFTSKIEGLFSSARKKEKDSRQQKNIVQGKEIIKKSKKRKAVFWIGMLGFSVGFIFLSLFFIFKISEDELQKKTYESIKNGGYAEEKVDESSLYRFFSFQLDNYEKLFSEENLKDAFDQKKLAISLSSLSESKINTQQASYDLYKKSLEGGTDLKTFYEKLISTTDEKIEAQKTFNSYLMDLNLDLYQIEERSVWQTALDNNKEELKNSLQFKRFLSSFKEFVSQSGRVNFLVLIQDSGEIRPSGGLLTELLVLSFDNAVLIDKQVLDVNDIDERIYGRKESSQEIKDILGEDLFYLHDANWQADFAKSNQEIKWFAEQVTGSKIDLTVALNTKTISEILKALGGVELPEKVLIDQQSYSERLEKTALLDYKNIGDKKFTWQFANALLKKMLSLEAEQLTAVNNILIKHLNEKEVLLQTSNSELQKTIEANSWSGGRVAISCPTEFKQENCILDSLYQVESNVGINKINPYIKETIEHNLGISKDFIRHKRKIVFENLSKSDVWPLGTYRNHLKFYLNSQASLEKIELDGKKIDERMVKIADTTDGKEISVLLEIPKQSKVELTVTYLISNQVKLPFSYVFFDQKQPGVFAKETTYNIVFDEQFKPQLIAPQAVYQDKTIHFENKNLDHFLFAISFNE